MPRNKRHKKHAKGRNKAFKHKTVRTNNTASTNFDNSFKENVLSEVSPVQTPSSRKTCVDKINMTPVNSRRSINRDRKLNYESMNVTNLNILFNSNHSYNTPKSTKEICINNSNIAYEIKANSNIPKIFSPNTDKLLSLSQKVNSDRVIESESIVKRCNEIPQTPKMTKVQLIQERLLEKSCAVPNNRSKNDVNCSNKLYGNEVNINPYLKNKESNKVVNTTFGEMAFFSPKNFQHKSSTPITKIYNQNKVDNINDCSFNIGKGDASELFLSPRTPNLHLNLNFNNATLSDKVQNKNDSLRSFKKHIVNISKKQSFLHSLESLENVPQLKVCDKSQQYSYSKIDVSKRSSLHDVSCENICKPQIIGKIFLWLKKCYRVFVNFPSKFKQSCSHFGVQVKSGMTYLYKIYNRNSKPVLDTTNKQPCNCREHRRDISSLNENIVELKKTVENLKIQIEGYRSSKENILILSEELKKTKEDVMQFANIRSEIQSLKEQVSSLQTPSINRIISNAGLHVQSAPPPPPPPPLPPMNLSEIPTNKLKLTRSNKSHSLDKDSCRPVISLDDILKVKLKKASERAYQTPVNCRKVQPVVSIDMLHQVKLRPASRTSLRSETIESTLDSTTSPHSSLARFLKTDSPATRLKRLRKVSGYSHDSVYRRNLLKRERDNS